MPDLRRSRRQYRSAGEAGRAAYPRSPGAAVARWRRWLARPRARRRRSWNDRRSRTAAILMISLKDRLRDVIKPGGRGPASSGGVRSCGSSDPPDDAIRICGSLDPPPDRDSIDPAEILGGVEDGQGFVVVE